MNNLIKILPYMKWMINKTTRSKNKMVETIPENYLDYLIADIQNNRIGEVDVLIDEDDIGVYHYRLYISILDHKNKLKFDFEFPISEIIYNQIKYKMELALGEPEKVNYNLNTARQFKVLNGGKLNGK